MRRVAMLAVVAVVATFARGAWGAREPVGWADIQVSVPDADIIIDGNVYGKSPLGAPVKLLKGKHTLKVVKPGHSEYLDVISIGVGKTLTIEVELIPLTAPVEVRSTPPGAIVVVDGSPVGKTPWQGELDPGPRKIRLQLDGYLPGEKSLDLMAGTPSSVDLTLLPIPPPPRAKRDGPSRPIYKKWWFWTAAGVLAIGTTALIITTTSDDPWAGADHMTVATW